MYATTKACVVIRMPKRKIIEIDEDKCTGCGQCVTACAEGALQIVDGKAKVVNEVFCDGLGACIGECPEGALRIIERDAPEFDEEAVKEHLSKSRSGTSHGHSTNRAHAATEPEPCGCPSSNPMLVKAKTAAHEETIPCGCPSSNPRAVKPMHEQAVQTSFADLPPELMNWPLQWRLIQPAMPFFKNADILLSADCVPFAFRDFHGKFLAGKPVVIGCPKLDDQAAYLDKLTALVQQATPRSLTVVRMEVPCCSGLTRMVHEAVRRAGIEVPVREIVVGIQGEILQET